MHRLFFRVAALEWQKETRQKFVLFPHRCLRPVFVRDALAHSAAIARVGPCNGHPSRFSPFAKRDLAYQIVVWRLPEAFTVGSAAAAPLGHGQPVLGGWI